MGQTFSSSQPKAPLVQAALLKESTEVIRLLEKGFPVDECDPSGNHGLGAASCAGSLEIVDLLLAKVPPPATTTINLPNAMGCSPTWLAAGYGHLDVLNRLLDQGGDPNACNGTGDSPLIAAASKSKVECCLRLLQCPGLDVSKLNSNQDSALSIAASKGLTQVVVALLAVLRTQREDTSSKPQQQGAEAEVDVLNVANKHGISPLGGAVAFGGAGGGSPFAVGAAGGGPGEGSEGDEAAIVSGLLSSGADPTTHRDRNGATALMVASHCANAAAVKALLKHLGQPSARDSGSGGGGDGGGGGGSGSAAAASDAVGAGSVAREHLEASDENGATALWLAAAAGATDVVELLLEAGADPLGGSPGGVTAEAAAEKNGHAAVVARMKLRPPALSA